MSIPDSFAFRFNDKPQFLHHADKDDEGIYHISWDRRHMNETNVSWYTCTEDEIDEFVMYSKDCWVLE